MNPLSDSDLERVLRHAPVPPPPARLLAELERGLDTHLPAPGPLAAPAPRPRRPSRAFRLWLPLTGLAGVFAAALAWTFLYLGAGSANVFAESLGALQRVKSFHVIERTRSGPAQTVLKDPKINPNTWPNYATSQHPANPLVETRHWFKADPDHPRSGFTRSSAPEREVWRAGNVELAVDRGSGRRRLSLTTGDRLFASLSSVSLHDGDDDGSREVHPAGASADVVVYEKRYHQNGETIILRLWVDRASRLPRRLQFLSPDFPAYAPEVVLQEYEFLDYDAEFPRETFAFEVTDEDLRTLGLTRADWAELDRSAVSFHLDGEAGLEIRGTLKDRSGTREISGRLPFAFVHVPRGKLTFQLDATDGQRHYLGLRFNSSNMGTSARRLVGELSDAGNSVRGED